MSNVFFAIEELKPCPFCGGGPAKRVQGTSFSGVELQYNGPTPGQVQHAISWGDDVGDCSFYVHCGTCGGMGPTHHKKDDAINAWKMRDA